MKISDLYDIYKKFPVISIDTRNIEKDSIFFALKGENFNANTFAEKAIQNGASYAVIDEKEYRKDERYILVDNVLYCLQQLAVYHRKQLNIPFIGITGTNGKTTTKELINAVLSAKYKTLATKGNLNNHIGVPLTILSVSNEHEMAVIEMGANHIGEIGELCEISKPDFGIITNIGKAHLEGFGGIDGVIKTKNDLYLAVNQNNGKLFVNSDNKLLMSLSENFERVCYGTSDTDYCKAKLLNNSALLNLEYWKNNLYVSEIQTNLVGDYNFENVLAAITVGLNFNVDALQIKAALENYIPGNNRSQIIKKNNNTIILDAYNANPSSMEASIKNFAKIDAENKVLIIGDMLELGEYTISEHQYIINLVDNLNFKDIILVGNVFCEVCKNPDYKCFKNSLEAKGWLAKNPFYNSTILIKGSRGIKMEEVLDVL